jgi:hypothetical protein
MLGVMCFTRMYRILLLGGIFKNTAQRLDGRACFGEQHDCWAKQAAIIARKQTTRTCACIVDEGSLAEEGPNTPHEEGGQEETRKKVLWRVRGSRGSTLSRHIPPPKKTPPEPNAFLPPHHVTQEWIDRSRRFHCSCDCSHLRVESQTAR